MRPLRLFLCYGQGMNLWNYSTSCGAVLAIALLVPPAATAAAPACPPGQVLAEPTKSPSAGSRSDAAGMPRVRITRPRCVPAVPKKACTDNCGCASTRGTVTKVSPPHMSEPAFGEVPVAALVPPSMPYPDQVPAGSPKGGPAPQPDCGVNQPK